MATVGGGVKNDQLFSYRGPHSRLYSGTPRNGLKLQSHENETGSEPMRLHFLSSCWSLKYESSRRNKSSKHKVGFPHSLMPSDQWLVTVFMLKKVIVDEQQQQKKKGVL